jgi:hypothetical protein
MNYIKQLSTVIEKFSEDDRLNTAHVSLYLALFQLWNLNRFKNPISINRAEVMKISKIGSKGTYHRCLNDFNNWSYLKYEPSHNPLKGSIVYMFNFETSIGQASVQVQGQLLTQVQGQVSEPSINNNKQKKQLNIKNFSVPTMEEIKDFFLSSEGGDLEAEKFFNYYSSKGWLVGNAKMKVWKAAAKNWMLNSKKFNSQKSNEPKANHLQVNQDKDYSIPL